jgi:uncharacterized membrane protein
MSRFAVLACLVAACSSDSSTGIDTSTLTCPPDSQLTYEGYGKLVIEEQCLSCHASKERPFLNTLEDVRKNRTAILSAAVASTSMPQDNDMLLEQREILGEWLVCGAP